MHPDIIPQATTPSLHIPPGFIVQTVPAAHVMQAPPLQASSVPHDVPSGALAPSLHWGAPEAHAIVPFLQGAPPLVEHGAPSAHGMQVPAALQTCPVPQLAPELLAVPFMQPTGSQTVMPFRHWSLFVWQARPAMQALQTPLKQSLFVSHAVPSRAFAPSSQTRPSAVQAMRPTLQGAFGFVSHVSAIGQAEPSCAPASK
jgi:hypothetical protein